VTALAQDAAELQAANETMGTYAQRTVDMRSTILNVYIGALGNFERTLSSASASDAAPDMVGAALKSAWKSARSEALSKLSGSSHVVSMFDAVSSEIDRATAASANLAAAEWCKELRRKLTDTAAAASNVGSLEADLKKEYASLSPDDKFDFITTLQYELEVMKGVRPPTTTKIEVALFAGWINANYTHCSLDGGNGYILIKINDGEVEKAIVKAPLGDKIEQGIDSAYGSDLIDLPVNKLICLYGPSFAGGKGWDCGCIDDRKQWVYPPRLVDADTLLRAASGVTQFKR
jgi:hypothetical protein